jgi:flagellar hook-length control protein FliK
MQSSDQQNAGAAHRETNVGARVESSMTSKATTGSSVSLGAVVTAPPMSPAAISSGQETPAASPAQQIAQILSVRAGGGSSALPPGAGSDRFGHVLPRASGEPASARKPEPSGTSPGQNDEVREVFEKLVRNIRLNAGTRNSTARIRLSPPELGQVRVEVKLRDENLSLRIHAETPEAREVLGERLESLRAALQQHGLVAERIELIHERPIWHGPMSGDAGLHTGTNAGADDRRTPDSAGEREDHTQGESRLSAGDLESAANELGPVQKARLDIRV